MAKTETTLTDHQRAVLQAAAYGKTLIVWPLPRRLNLSKASATLVVKGLLRKGLVEERLALGNDPVWRESEDGRTMTLVITKAGLTAVGMSPADMPTEKAKHGPTPPVSENQPRMPRAGSKLAALVELLGRDEGATIEEMVAATGWLPHTARAVVSGTLKSKFGLRIVSGKTGERGRVYRVERGSASGTDEVGSTGE